MINALIRPVRFHLVLAGLLGISVAPDARAADNLAIVLAGPCASCHGAEGNSNGQSMPSLAGTNYYYFLNAMFSYQKDKRIGTIMNRIAKGYSEGELQIMAEYFEAMQFQPAQQEFDETLAARGMELHQQYCQDSCHKDGGATTDDTGMLAGQWTVFLKNAFSDMHEGRSQQLPKMNAKVQSLLEDHGEEAMEALWNYYASQQ